MDFASAILLPPLGSPSAIVEYLSSHRNVREMLLLFKVLALDDTHDRVSKLNLHLRNLISLKHILQSDFIKSLIVFYLVTCF